MQRRESPPCHRRCGCTIVKGYHREATVSGADCAATTGRVCVGALLATGIDLGARTAEGGQAENWSSSGWVAQRRQRNQQTYIISRDEQLMLDSAAVAKICWDSQQRGSVGRFCRHRDHRQGYHTNAPLQSALHAYQAPSCHSLPRWRMSIRQYSGHIFEWPGARCA